MCNTEDCLHYDYVRLAWDIGFAFEEYDMKHGFDISVIGLVDVDKVAKERDIPTVVKHIPTLLNFRLDNEMGKVLEPNFIKLFRLSQLAIQYLIFCKKYLDSTVALIKNEVVAINDEKSDLEVYLKELQLDNETVKRKYDELKATLSTALFKCDECGKTFYSEEYLLAHQRRRHFVVHDNQMQTEADKLQLEIKELKQRLNSTERFILNNENKSDEKDKDEKISPKESEDDKEKELESVEPNNDDVKENSIQFKFEQLKNHIETEINSLKDEDFYKGICERYIKERVEKNLSITTIQSGIDKQDENIQAKGSSVTVTIDTTDADNSKLNLVKAESSTQTELKNTVSEGTSMSPQPTPRKLSKSHDEDGDRTSQTVATSTNDTNDASSRRTSVDESSNTENKSSQVVIRSIEEKLAKEAEHQRETLEHILDLKLSGSLIKMEAQMTAFWQKLNAWESNLTARSSSVPSINVHSEPVKNTSVHRENGDVTIRRQNSVGSLASNSPIHKITPRDHNVHDAKSQIEAKAPKALPRSFNTNKQNSPVMVVPKVIEPIVNVRNNDVTRFLDSSDEEDKNTDKSSESTSEEETPSNIKPTDSFRKRLDETLLQRLKPSATLKPVEPKVKPPVLHKMSKHVSQDGGPSKPTKVSKIVENKNNSDEDDESDYNDLKKRLKRHVEESVSQKLKEIGVSPHWKCLPEKSYNKAMEIVEHQANLSKKTIHDFHKIRKNIERSIDKEIEKNNEVRKRRTTQNLPTSVSDNEGATPSESYAPSESSVDIPLQRVTGRPTIKPNSRRGSMQTESSIQSPVLNYTQQQSTLKVLKGKKPENNVVTIIPSKQTKPEVRAVNTTGTATATSSAPTFATAESAPPQNNKKKVLFNLESDTDLSSQQSPEKLPKPQLQNKKDLTSFVEQEKTKLNVEKQGKQRKQLELHTGSESSDWDISDIT
ncbi:cilium assembly protein DZIP1L [Atheta coriaria]|uniref:cilium assembly protein DZIP1L n=1 Tax=Dalotia coriaria TaxID=877792 RepID=UPI0031F3F940